MAVQSVPGPHGVPKSPYASFAGKVGVSIDGSSTVTLALQYDAAQIVSDGLQWHIIARIGTAILLMLLI